MGDDRALRTSTQPDRAKRQAALEYRRKQFERIFWSKYRSFRTHGSTISQVRETIISLEYSNEHKVLSWASSLDIHLFDQILHQGDNSPVVHKTTKEMDRGRFQCVDVWRLVRHMALPALIATLSHTHVLLCPDKPFGVAHQADDDTRAFGEVIKTLRNHIQS